MASGDPVVQIIEVMPVLDQAYFQKRLGASSPAERLGYWRFNDGVIWNLDFKCWLEGYDGGGLTWTLPWMAGGTSTSNAVRLGVAVRLIADDADDFDTSHTYDFNETDDTAPTVNGELSLPTITMTDGADMDSWANRTFAIVRVRRNGTHANDDMTDPAQLLGLVGRET